MSIFGHESRFMGWMISPPVRIFMRTIRLFHVPQFGINVIPMPRGAEIILTAGEPDDSSLWALVDERAPIVQRVLLTVRPEGEPSETNDYTCVGSCLLADGSYARVFDLGETYSNEVSVESDGRQARLPHSAEF
jgi:hypothetical protein